MSVSMALKPMLFAAASLSSISFACAQDAMQDDRSDDEIIVTANKRAQRAQDVATPLSVLDEGAIERSNSGSVSDLGTQVPSLNFSADNSDSKVTIRGVGSDNVDPNTQQGVALHQDGVYLGRPASFGIALYDAQRVEVLRGPQGTLYGRNATGGAINVVTNQPEHQFGVGMEMLYGSEDRMRARGFVNLPIVDDTLALRATGIREVREGFQTNLKPGGSEGDDLDIAYIRGQLRWDIAPGSAITARASYYRSGGVGPVRNRLASPVDGAAVYADPRVTFKDLRETSDLDQALYAIDGSFDLGPVTATLLVNYSNFDSAINQDTDASPTSVPLPGGRDWRLGIVSDSHQFSTEARLNSNGTGPLTWLVGAFYFDEDVTQLGNISLRQSLIPPAFTISSLSSNSTLNVKNKSYAGFADLTYKFGTVSLNLGARYTKDEVRGSYVEAQRNVGIPFCFAFPPGTPCITNTSERPARDFSKFTWKVGLDWDVTPDNKLYGTVSTGFRAGGFNTGTAAADLYYDPEDLTAFEIGSKNAFFDNRVILNLSGFYYDYKNQQINQIINFAGLVQNSESEVYGAEAELIFRASTRFHVDAHIAYLSATVKSFVSEDPARPNGPDGIPANGDRFVVSGNHLANTPEWSGHLGATYTLPLGGAGELILRGQTYFQSRSYLRVFNLEPFDAQRSYTKSDIFLTYDSKNHWSVFGGVTNIEDEDVLSGIEVTPAGRFLGGYRAPRTWMAGLNFRF